MRVRTTGSRRVLVRAARRPAKSVAGNGKGSAASAVLGRCSCTGRYRCGKALDLRCTERESVCEPSVRWNGFLATGEDVLVRARVVELRKFSSTQNTLPFVRTPELSAG